MFLLEKWYGDVVTTQGAGAIVYAARLRWGPLRLGYGATLLFSGDEPSQEHATTRGVALPAIETGVATWRNERLCVDASWCRDADPIDACLLDGTGGAIHWTCHMPRALARVRVGDITLNGLGYVEQVRLTTPPANLPFRGGALRWGRYVSRRHAAVWIEWTGGDRRQWAWVDGIEQVGFGDLGDQRRLAFRDTRTIRDQPLLAIVRVPLPRLARRLTGTLDTAREHKWLSRAALVRGAGIEDEGWAIHEEVLW